MNIDEIYELVIKLRHAIDRAADNREFNGIICFDHFPRGCCGMASDILGHYLIEHGIESNYVCGTYRDGGFENNRSHAWVELYDGTIIDITGDQFKYDDVFLRYDVPVYFGPMDAFHEMFEVEECDIRPSVRLEDMSGMVEPLFRAMEIINRYI